MYRIGIDLGGTNIAAAVVSNDFKIVKKMSVPTGAERDAALLMDDMASLCRNVCAEVGISISDIEAIGIASPGVANHTDGVIEYSCNLPFRKYPICAELSTRLGVDNIHVENDANAAAWGEAVAGAAKGSQDSVMITLGTGVGGGVIIGGKVFSGFNYAGTELGHVVISVGGRPCNCGRRGCWEAYSSATALIKMTAEKIEECKESGRYTLMTEMVEKKGKVSGRTAFQAMREGDEAAGEVVGFVAGKTSRRGAKIMLSCRLGTKYPVAHFDYIQHTRRYLGGIGGLPPFSYICCCQAAAPLAFKPPMRLSLYVKVSIA